MRWYLAWENLIRELFEVHIRVFQPNKNVLRLWQTEVPLVEDAHMDSHAKYQPIWLRIGLSPASWNLHGNSYWTFVFFVQSFLQVWGQHGFTRNKDRCVGDGPMNKFQKELGLSILSPRCALDRRPVSPKPTIHPSKASNFLSMLWRLVHIHILTPLPVSYFHG